MNKNNVYVITGPSGSGKSTICNQIAERGVRVMDLDEVPGVSHSRDGIGNEYDVGKVIRLINTRDVTQPLVIFGLATNVVELMHKLEQRGAIIGAISVSNEEVIRRRIARGKPFDLALSAIEHRRDLHKYHELVTPHTRFKIRNADELMVKIGLKR